MHPLNKRAREAVDRLINAFNEPEKLIDTIMRATLIPNNSPCRKWSPSNRFLVALAGTGDARGYRQWQEVVLQSIRDLPRNGMTKNGRLF